MNQEKEQLERIKEFLLKEYPQFPGFVKHTLVAEMASKYANELLKLRLEKARYNGGKTERRHISPDFWDGWHKALDYIETPSDQ